MILAIIGIAAQLFGWWRDFTKTKEANALGIKEKNWLYKDKAGMMDVKKAIFLCFGIEYGVAIGAYFFTEGFKNAEQSSSAGWYAFGCVLISFGLFHFIYSLQSAKAINYLKTQQRKVF